jgi:hypothetical protein
VILRLLTTRRKLVHAVEHDRGIVNKRRRVGLTVLLEAMAVGGVSPVSGTVLDTPQVLLDMRVGLCYLIAT